MTIYVALLRAVNAGVTLPMAKLRAVCERLGFRRVRTYIASGNVVLDADDDAPTVAAALESALAKLVGRPVGVVVRDRADLQRSFAANPFQEAPPNKCVIVFLKDAPPADALSRVTGRASERIALGEREIYIDYPHWIGASKLKMPALTLGTARNLNTVAKLIALAEKTDGGGSA